MPSREEIMKGTEDVIWLALKATTRMTTKRIDSIAPKVRLAATSYLHSQGVAIKVDRELPPLISREIYDKHEIAVAIIQAARMIDDGYTATVPLIKEVTNGKGI